MWSWTVLSPYRVAHDGLPRYCRIMRRQAGLRWTVGLTAATCLFLLGAYVVPGLTGASSGSSSGAGCVKPQSLTVMDGRGPSGAPWRVVATIEDNGGCASWLFGSEFKPTGKPPGTFLSRFAIPAHGQLSKRFTIAATDQGLPGERSFGGMVGSRVAKLRVTTSEGKREIIRPRLPSSQLLQRYAWLRGVRYFMHFYPARARVVSVALLDSSGRAVYTAKGQEGEFEGPT